MPCPSPLAPTRSCLVSHVLIYINISIHTHLDGASLSTQVDKHSSGCSHSRRLLSAAYKNSHFIAHHSFDQLSRSNLKFALVSTLLSSPVVLRLRNSTPRLLAAWPTESVCAVFLAFRYNSYHKQPLCCCAQVGCICNYLQLQRCTLKLITLAVQSNGDTVSKPAATAQSHCSAAQKSHSW